jgi:orotate phosphoribosyltransferase
MKLNEQIAELLLKHKAVFLRPQEPFTWASGLKSPVYCDNRLLISSVEAREKVINAFCEKIKQLHVSSIAGTATAGIPWASWIAHELKLPLIYVRSSGKDHGRQNAIEGFIPSGSKVILIEDLISTGKSSIAAAKKLQEQGIIVEKVMSIFSYGFPQVSEIFEKENISYDSLSSFEVLSKVAYDNNVLDSQNLNLVLEWQKSVEFP